MNNMLKSQAYAEAGVDTQKAARIVDRIKESCNKTQRSGSMNQIGEFAGMFDLMRSGQWKDPILVSSTDGVGTKLRLATRLNKHYGIGIDLVAMCVNDIIVHGATPLFFMDYFSSSKLEEEVVETVIAGIADGCQQSQAALIGGEMAEMPGHYAVGDYDLAGFVVGAVEKNNRLPRHDLQIGDCVLGLESSGFHANGFSLIQKIIADNAVDLEQKWSTDTHATLGDALLEPTRIYVNSILQICQEPFIKAIAHITGGGFYENIPRVVPNHLQVVLEARALPSSDIFVYIQELGNLTTHDMWHTFNCGIGMVLVVGKEHCDNVKKILQDQGERVHILGHIESNHDGQKGVKII